MNGHLVAIEVGVERGTYQRMQLDGLAFNQYRLERLDAQPVQRRCPVEQDRVLADNFGQDIPNLGTFCFYQFLGRLDGGRHTATLQFAEDKRLEQFQRHLFRQATFVQSQFGTNHDDRTTGIIDSLTQQVLTESALLTLDHVGQGLEWTLVRTRYGTTATAIVQQCIDSFLQHTLLVAHDNVRRVEFQQTFQAIVTVDRTSVQIVQVRCRKTSTIQWNQRTKVRWQYWQHGQDHVFRAIAGINEGFYQFYPLGQAFQFCDRPRRADLPAQPDLFLAQDNASKQVKNSFGAHLRFKLVTPMFQGIEVLLVGEQLATLEVGQAGIKHNI